MTVAMGFAAIVFIEYLVLGSRTTSRIGVTLPSILLMYVGGGVLAGIILGVGRPLGRTQVGSMVLGVFVATCVYVSAGIAIYGLPNHWHGKEWFSTVVVGILIGALSGNMFYKDTE